MSVTIKIGILAKDTWDNLNMICGYVTSGNYTSLQSPIGTYYQVGPGNILRATAFCFQSPIAGAGVQIGYGDTSVNLSASPPTNPVIMTSWIVQETANKINKVELWIKIPSGKYPFIKATGGDIVASLMGFEED